MTALSHPAIAAGEPAKPLKVFILAGQSNLQGQGIVAGQNTDGSEMPGSLGSMLHNPAIVLKFMLNRVFPPRRRVGGCVASIQVITPTKKS